MPSLLRFLAVIAILCAARLWRSIFAGAFRATETARNHRLDPARQILQEPLRAQADGAQGGSRQAARRGEHVRRRAAGRALSRHAGGRAGRREKHARRLWPRSCRFHRSTSRGAKRSVATATTDDLRAYLERRSPDAACRPRPWRGGFRRSGSSIGSSTRKGSARTIPPPCWQVRSAGARCRKRSRSPKSIACCA